MLYFETSANLATVGAIIIAPLLGGLGPLVCQGKLTSDHNHLSVSQSVEYQLSEYLRSCFSVWELLTGTISDGSGAREALFH